MGAVELTQIRNKLKPTTRKQLAVGFSFYLGNLIGMEPIVETILLRTVRSWSL
jgi:hypothetical protein